MDYKGAGWDDMGLFHLAEGRDKWRALVNMELNLCVQPTSQCDASPLLTWWKT
jgi:hypothetical protein